MVRSPDGSILYVGLTSIELPTEAGARARAWARALPEFAHVSDIPFHVLVEAIRQDARRELIEAIEKEILKDTTTKSDVERTIVKEYEP